MKTCCHSHFYANFHASVTLIFFIGFSRNFLQNVELRNWEWYTYTFWRVFAILNWEGAVIPPQIRLWRVCAFIRYKTPQYLFMDILNIGPDRQSNLPKIVNILLSININICFGCSKEPSHWDGSFEHPQHMFWLRNKKIIFEYTLLSEGMIGIKKISQKLCIFSYPSISTFVLGAQKNRLIETVLFSTHNICFGWEIRKSFFNTLIWRPDIRWLVVWIYTHLVYWYVS